MRAIGGVLILMRTLSLLCLLALGGCHAIERPSGRSALIARDAGTIAGSWRESRRNGRPVQGGYALSISSFEVPTFAVQKDCVATGGLLRPVATTTYRLERYETGFSIEGCGPWRSGPEIAPFDGVQINLIRHGQVLVAEGGGTRVEFRRLPVPVI